MSDRNVSDDVIRVHLENPEDVRPGNVEEREPEHFVFSTVAVAFNTAGYNNSEQLLAEDPLRKDFSVLSVDNPVVICHSASQLTDPANQVANTPYPQGALVPAGVSVTGTGTGRVWVVATTAQPSRVSVFINRRNT